MQGLLTIEKDWKNINDLDFVDINGTRLVQDIKDGDKVRFLVGTNDVFNPILLWQGAQPTSDSLAGTITLQDVVVFGVSSEDVYLKVLDTKKSITIEIIRGV